MKMLQISQYWQFIFNRRMFFIDVGINMCIYVYMDCLEDMSDPIMSTSKFKLYLYDKYFLKLFQNLAP